MEPTVRLFVLVDAAKGGRAPDILVAHQRQRARDVERILSELLGLPLRVAALPRYCRPQDDAQPDLPPQQQSVVVLEAVPREALGLLERNFRANEDQLAGINISVDLPIAAAEAWCPGTAASPLFGTLNQALARIGADALAGTGADGEDVHVIIVDQGLDADYFAGGTLIGTDGRPRGWTVQPVPVPGQPDTPRPPGTARFGHGTRMAELVLSVAPKAKLYDLPLLPDRIRDLGAFLSDAITAMVEVLPYVAATRALWGWRWVLCNAWNVYDLAGDAPPDSLFNYGQNPINPVTALFDGLTLLGADVVVAAGNCGQSCPDGRCGSGQVGPGNGIYGVPALDRVLTLGAVRHDGLRLGYSSQGPAPPRFESSKPDLCAPSQFAAMGDAHIGFTGTSAACALAAGAVAALRSPAFGLAGQVPNDPRDLIRLLRETAALAPGQAGPGDPGLGDGILDLRAALRRLRPAPATA